ncbi:MAG TPA: electron transport complex subunit RsxG [Candidatus Sulfotelmatobacter sp.]|jgi:electron transport complex protein RnfG|nr:electron transport complex subunit RsxG [Candidatus Sulfotelmatobacter sp.]
MSEQRPITHAVVLGAFCLGFGVLLAATDLVTHDKIDLRKVEDLQNSLVQVIPPTIHDNNPVKDAVQVKNDEGKDVTVYRAIKAGKVTGVAYAIEGTGYGGPISLILGVDADGKILGVRATAFKETPGLGDKIDPAKSDWITRFTGLSLGNPVADKWKVKKDGGQFDQFAGATITPRGVVAAIKSGLDFFAAHKAEFLEVR